MEKKGLNTLKFLGVWVPLQHVKLIQRVCHARGENLSSFVRRALKRELARLSFLGELEKKALGFRRTEDDKRE